MSACIMPLPNLVLKYEKRLAALRLSPKILQNDIAKLAEKFSGIISRLANSHRFYLGEKTIPVGKRG